MLWKEIQTNILKISTKALIRKIGNKSLGYIIKMIIYTSQFLLLLSHVVLGYTLDNNVDDTVDEETTTEIPTTQVPNPKLGTRAACTQVNCGRQCSSLTFMNKYYNKHGNCKRSESSYFHKTCS